MNNLHGFIAVQPNWGGGVCESPPGTEMEITVTGGVDIITGGSTPRQFSHCIRLTRNEMFVQNDVHK